ncbi:MAG TPA: NAD(P)H-binding protein [Cellulomonas sp.]
MARITVLGGTGYTGGNIVREAAARGHEVRSVSRNAPAEETPGVRYELGSLLDAQTRERVIAGADVVIAALAPRGDLEGALGDVYARVEELAAAGGARLGVVGGFSSLRPAEGAPRFAAGDDMPPEYAAEGRAMAGVVDHLVDAAPDGLDWFYVSPAATYGSYVPGETTGTYRVGTDVAFYDAQGSSAISGTDFASAILDEVDDPRHRRTQLSIAY